MVSHLFFYQLTLIALVWLCLMLQWMWPSDSAACPTIPEPLPPLPKRKREPTPFAGLTTSPSKVLLFLVTLCLWLPGSFGEIIQSFAFFLQRCRKAYREV